METMKLDGIKGMEEAIRWMRSEIAKLILIIEGDVDATNFDWQIFKEKMEEERPFESLSEESQIAYWCGMMQAYHDSLKYCEESADKLLYD